MSDVPAFLDARTISQLLGGLHPGTIRKWLARGDFGPTRPVGGRGRMITREQFLAWWEKGVETTPARRAPRELQVDPEIEAALNRPGRPRRKARSPPVN